MHKPNPNKPVSTVWENVCAVLVLPSPPNNCSANDWYWRLICGVPFLMRNLFNLQRSGLNSLIIYSNENNAELYKRICEEKNISFKLNWTANVAEVTKLTNDYSILILNGGALYTKHEIQSCTNSSANRNENSIQFLKRKNMANTLDQIVRGNEFSLIPSIVNSDSGVIFLPGGKDSWLRRPQDFLIQHENLLKDSGLKNDSFVDRTITRFFSRQITRFFLQTSLSPNIITLLSLVIGLVSAGYFFQGTYENILIGAGLLLLSAWIDCTDGEIARLKFMESKVGGKLDIICDNLVHIAVFFAIGMGLYQTTGQTVFIILGAFAVLGNLISFLFLSSSIIDEKKRSSGNTPGLIVKKDLSAKLANRDFIYLIFLMALIGRVDIFIFITAVGSNVFASYLIYSRFKPYSLTR